MGFLLETERLIFRHIQDSDMESFLKYRNDAEIAKYQGWDLPYSRDDFVELLDKLDKELPIEPGGRFKVALALKSTDELIGEIGFQLHRHDARQAHIGGSIARSFWRRGYALEATSALVDFLFNECDLHRVTAEIDVDNVPSWHLVEKLGFRREAHFIKNMPSKGNYGSEYHYALLRKEWAGR